MSALRPTGAQIAAADPAASAWVSANAGSGKTRVLTQRVARLLLAGTRPERILCVTYTKAAAAEMQGRLFTLLGGWALADDAVLGAELAALEGRETPETDPDRLADARRLFAEALETPGGLRIQTIHAFCDALLRRFPLEAGVSPRFEVMDERASRELLMRLRADLAAEAERDGTGPFDGVAGRLNEDQIDALIGAVLSKRREFSLPGWEERLDALFGEAARESPETLAAEHLAELDRDRLEAHAALLHRLGGKADRALAAAIDAAVADWQAGAALRAAATLSGAMFTTAGTLRGPRGFPVNAVKAEDPGAEALTGFLRDWASRCRDRLAAAETAGRTRDLHRFAHALLDRYAAEKAARGLLDFDDLVSRAAALLTEAEMRGWVLYKLDAGLAHVLVDEAQDTSPAQWRIVESLAEEFTAGQGAGPSRRTLFVVGDEKQSIYSFQGAEPGAFAEMRGRFGAALAATGQDLARPDLVTSFRSAPDVLRFVDAVFEGEDHGLTVERGAIRHEAFRAGDPARVDLWPLVEPEETGDPPPWHAPVEAAKLESPALRLARRLAREIDRMIREDTLPPRGGKPARPVTAGDILVLVRARGPLDRALLAELKSLRVPVAGADRLSLARALAARDLLAAVKTSLTPGDDLSLAALLRSPLSDLSEEDLYALAAGRRGTLRAALMAAGDRHPREVEMLRDLAAHADYLRPYEFLERILIRHGGQQRLLARLGPEAADVIDALLDAALAQEAAEPPSLMGFLRWVEDGDIEVKREMDQSRAAVRIMTVHGAKGLEAPVVILPDTMRAPRGPRGLELAPAAQDPDTLVWLSSKGEDDAVAKGARDALAEREAAEHRRLLYVALTRAEDWLILCGAGKPADAARQERWYGPLEDAMTRLGGQPVPGPEGTEIRRLGPGIDPRPERAEPALAAPAPRPDWIAAAAREERPPRVSPSALPGLEAPPDAPQAPLAGRDRESALAHGRAVHALLERLSDRPPEDRPALANALLAQQQPGLGAEARAAALAEAGRVWAAPFADEVFGPGSLAEAGIAIPLPRLGDTPAIGRIDRLVVTPEAVRVIDFKTDAVPPERADAVAPAYLAQLGAYVQGLEAVFPGRAVEAALLWTAAPALMPLPRDALADALARAHRAP